MNATARDATPQLSVVFLTYNRADLLEVSYHSVVGALRRLPVTFETVVSDDASDAPHRARIDALAADRTLFAPRNRGLSDNHNKALRACRADRVLSLQDDWLFVGDPGVVATALHILDADPQVGIVNFLPPSVPLPCERRYTAAGAAYDVYENDGLARQRASGSRPYSDRPHLKSRACIDDLGHYREDLPMTGAELEFQQRVACQVRWRVAWVAGPPAFQHLGDARSFNPGQLRAERIARWQALPLVGPPYRWLRAIARRCLRRSRVPD